LKILIQTFNEVYEEILENHPRFPEMQLWRLMNKAWIKNVYTDSTINQALITCFEKILSKRRI
jgi:hypothetical protein